MSLHFVSLRVRQRDNPSTGPVSFVTEKGLFIRLDPDIDRDDSFRVPVST